jgi:heavy metal translocating P-type ATPase
LIPFIFDEFFASGKEESISPFLTPSSRKWGKNVSLRSCLLAAALLLAAFLTSYVHPTASHFLLLLVYFLVGTPALIDTFEDLKNLEINIDVLMTLAALLSVLIGSGMEGALLLVLFELSAAMENGVTQKTKGALLNLHQLAPKTAYVLKADGTLLERAVKEIDIKEHLLIKAGELIPLDGVVIQGSSSINLSHLTGESIPVHKTVGNEVPAGARNLSGSLTIEVTRTSSDSTLSRIIQLITQAQMAKPRLQRLLDRFGKTYAITIICLFFFFALTLPLFFSISYTGPDGAIYRALTFLIAASPCALIIATPTAYLSAISCCARKGILLKGGVVLDALASCSLVAFDKTGTLTTGKLRCTAIESPTGPMDFQRFGTDQGPTCEASYTPDQALAIAAGLERHAMHPIAEAITALAQEKQIPPQKIDNFQSLAGFGLQGEAVLCGEKVHVYIGHRAFIASKLPSSHHAALDAMLNKEGLSNTFLLIKDQLFLFHFLDTVRPEAPALIARLKEKEKLFPMMLTGDHPEMAQLIAKQVGIDAVFAHLRPEDKLLKVADLSHKRGLIMVGDGVNDAPALARATVGISLGKIGSATAVDASDVVFLNDDLFLLDWLYRKAHQTMRIVKQNLTLALGVIVLATTPALLGIIPLWAAVILHEGGTVLVGINSLRLLRVR